MPSRPRASARSRQRRSFSLGTTLLKMRMPAEAEACYRYVLRFTARVTSTR